MSYRIRWGAVWVCAAAVVGVQDAGAMHRFWDLAGDGLWNVAANWTPTGIPLTTDEVFIGDDVFPQGFTTTLNVDDTIASLSVRNGSDLALNGHQLIVTGLTTVDGAGSTITIGPRGTGDFDGLDARGVSIVNGGAVVLDGGILELESGELEIGATASGDGLGGHGTIELIQSGTGGVQVLENSGRLFVGAGGDSTLTITRVDTSDGGVIGDGEVDLDGDGESGIVDVDGAGALTLNVLAPLDDPFDGQMLIGVADTVHIANDWTLGTGTGGLIRFSGGDGADRAALSGGRVTIDDLASVVEVQSGTAVVSADVALGEGLIELTGPSQTLRFDGGLTATGGTIRNRGLLVFNTDATIGSTADLDMSGASASLTVGAGATVTIDDVDVGLAGDGAAGNAVVVEHGGRLNLNGFDPSGRFDGDLTLRGGEAAVDRPGATRWTLDGLGPATLTLDHNGVAPRLLGDDLVVGDGSFGDAGRIVATGSGRSSIAANVELFPEAQVQIDTGATLDLEAAVMYIGGTTAGQGVFDPGATNRVLAFTTIGTPGTNTLTIDLDGGDAPGVDPEWVLNADLTLNVAAIDDGDGSFDGDEIAINGLATLTVNLPGEEAWSVGPTSTIDIGGFIGGLISASIDGSDLNFNGTAEVTGRSFWGARVDLGGTARVTTEDADATIRFAGGNDADPNTINGATIDGPGKLTASQGDSLVGFGTIDTAFVDLDGNAELLADNGTLIVNAAFESVGTIGTADDDGVFELNTTLTVSGGSNDAIELLGGEFAGTGRVNSRGATIRGHGSLTNTDGAVGIDNGGTIAAEGGTLEFAAVVDLDGTGAGGIDDGDGVVEALNGDVIVRALTEANFNGRMDIAAGRTFTFDSGGAGDVFIVAASGGYGDPSAQAGRLNLTGGTVEADTIQLAGELNTTLAAGTLRGGAVSFAAGGVNTMAVDLRVDGDAAVDAGATFTGGGALVNSAGHTMMLADGASVGVTIDNRGTLKIGALPGAATVAALTQADDARLLIQIASDDPLNGYDRLGVTGNFDLSGILDVELIGGFTPSPGDTFDVLDFATTTGTFDRVDLDGAALPASLAWDTADLMAGGVLRVVASIKGDVDFDGGVTMLDINAFLAVLNGLEANPAAVAAADINMDGDVTEADINGFIALVGGPASPGPLGASAASHALPEPAGLIPLMVGGMMAAGRRRPRCRAGVGPCHNGATLRPGGAGAETI